MKKWLLAAAAAMTLAGGAAMAQPYGGYGGGYDRAPAYDYGRGERGYYRSEYRDSDRDGIPDRAEWGRDRDRDGRPDQWDRYDNRRYRHHRHDGYSHRYERAPYDGYRD
jgi:opacity protein-like surface antigen